MRSRGVQLLDFKGFCMLRSRRRLLLLILYVILACGGLLPLLAYAKPLRVVPGEYLVRMPQLGSAAPSISLPSSVQVVRFGERHLLLRAREVQGVAADYSSATDLCRTELRALPDCTPNVLFDRDAIPNDTHFALLSGLDGAPVDIDAPEAWDLTTGGKNVAVAVMDAGVDYNHPDLAANMWTNPGEIPGNQIDDDHNGYVDDRHGIDAVHHTGDPQAVDAHGTHVAGTIGAVGHNGRGVTGVAWSTNIIAVRIFRSAAEGDGAPLSAIIDAFDYLIDLRERGVPLRAVNGSFGTSSYVSSFEDAVRRLGEAGVLFVASSGNEGTNNDNSPRYPANFRFPHVISVAASDANGALAEFSNYGVATVDLAAPGVDILSTVSGGYQFFSGTSMAAPHVTGAIALLASYRPELNYLQLRQMILASAKAVPALQGKLVVPGVLNVASLLRTPPPDVVAPNGGLPFISRGQFSVAAFGARSKRLTVRTSEPLVIDVIRQDFLERPGTSGFLVQVQLNGNSCDYAARIASLPYRGLRLQGKLRMFKESNTLRLTVLNSRGDVTGDTVVRIQAQARGASRPSKKVLRTLSYTQNACAGFVRSLSALAPIN